MSNKRIPMISYRAVWSLWSQMQQWDMREHWSISIALNVRCASKMSELSVLKAEEAVKMRLLHKILWFQMSSLRSTILKTFRSSKDLKLNRSNQFKSKTQQSYKLQSKMMILLSNRTRKNLKMINNSRKTREIYRNGREQKTQSLSSNWMTLERKSRMSRVAKVVS